MSPKASGYFEVKICDVRKGLSVRLWVNEKFSKARIRVQDFGVKIVGAFFPYPIQHRHLFFLEYDAVL